MLDTEVASTGEPEVAPGLDHLGPRHGGRDALGTAVLRVVVDDDELKPVCGPLDVVEGPQAGDGVLGTLVVDEDH